MKFPPKIRLAVIIVLGVILAGWVWSCAHRRADGEGKPLLNIGKTESRSNSTSTSTSSSTANSTFSAERVILFSDNPHPLCRRIIQMVANKLKDNSHISKLIVTNAAYTITDAQAAPDLFLNINLESLEDSFLSRTMKSVVTASLGNEPWMSQNYTRDDSTPPILEFDWQATHETESTFTGIRTDRYADVAKSVADSIANEVAKKIEENAGKYPAIGALPPMFYGPYQPVVDFDFLKTVQATREASYAGLLLHNETFWRFNTATNPTPELNQIVHQLETAGWKVTESETTNSTGNRIAAQRENTSLTVYQLRESGAFFNFDSPQKKSFKFAVRYRQPFSRAEREAAIDMLLTNGAPCDVLLSFSDSMSSSQRKSFFKLVETSPASSPQACVQLAEVFLNRHQTNDATRMLVRAKALSATLPNSSELETKISDLAKKISRKKPLKLEVTPEVCEGLGFIALTNLNSGIEVKLPPGQSLVFFGPGKRDTKIYSLNIGRLRNGRFPWSFVQIEEGSFMRSYSETSLSSSGDWEHSFSENGKTIRIRVTPQSSGQIKYQVSVKSQ